MALGTGMIEPRPFLRASMASKQIVLCALFLTAAPFAYAHDPAGTPKNYCEPQAEWDVHDYGAPANGVLFQGYEDGNLAADCDGATSVNPGTPCAGFEDPADPLSFYAGLCDSDVNLPFADPDGHAEYALGGAWLLACDWACGDDGLGGGSTACFGDVAHHAAFPSVSVQDVVLGSGVVFDVAADHVDVVATAVGLPQDPCGDFENDVSQGCVGECTVAFGPGRDGAYQVLVQGTAGHVGVGGGGGGDPPQTGDLGIPGPLILNVYYNGTGTDVDWVYEGSFDCQPGSLHFRDFIFYCTPLAIVEWHCVNPGVEVTHLGPMGTGPSASYSRGGFVCGTLAGSCQTPVGAGSCFQPVWGEDWARYDCSGAYVGFVPPSTPVAMQVTCYSDPPAIPILQDQ